MKTITFFDTGNLARVRGIWVRGSVAPQLLTTSNFIGPWYHTALLFSGLGSIVLLFGVLFSHQIREDLVKAVTSPMGVGDRGKPHAGYLATQITAAKTITFVAHCALLFFTC